MRRCLFLPLLAALLLGAARAAEVIPPAPAAYFNDYAGVVSPGAAAALNAQLDQFERQTSNQLLVAIYSHMQSDSSIDDYTQRVAESWRAGQKGRNNGAVLFIFAQDHKASIETGYGLESVLPDAICSQILRAELFPRLRQGDYDGGVRAAVAAMMAATRGEYRGTGRTARDGRGGGGLPLPLPVIIFIVILLLSSFLRSRQHVVYRGAGRRTLWGGGGPWIFPGGGGGGGGFGGGGFGGGGGGGGFSGGGGHFGGGGASGSW